MAIVFFQPVPSGVIGFISDDVTGAASYEAAPASEGPIMETATSTGPLTGLRRAEGLKGPLVTIPHATEGRKPPMYTAPEGPVVTKEPMSGAEWVNLHTAPRVQFTPNVHGVGDTFFELSNSAGP